MLTTTDAKVSRTHLNSQLNSLSVVGLTSVNHVNQDHLSEASYTDEDLNDKSRDKFVTTSSNPSRVMCLGNQRDVIVLPNLLLASFQREIFNFIPFLQIFNTLY